MDTKKILLALGSYTKSAPHVPDAQGKGIEIVLFDEGTGNITPVQSIGGIINPSYLCWNSARSLIHAVSEKSEGKGCIVSYIRGGDKLFTPVDDLEGPGRDGCYVSIDSKGDSLFSASYSDGSSVGYDLTKTDSDGKLFHFDYEGNGPFAGRQESAHAHQILPGPAGDDYLYVSDLGSDRIWFHSGKDGYSSIGTALEVPGGYGPRHMAFDSDGKHVYILCELKPRLLVAEITSPESWKLLQDLPVGEESFGQAVAPAAVKVHPSGKSVVASNRFADRLEIFTVKRDGDQLELIWKEGISAGGKTPRDICFSPSGRWLLIANQDSHDLQIRGFDGESGLPDHDRSASYKTGSPVCIVPLL